MRTEYKTTGREIGEHNDPIRPEGRGWKFAGGAANATTLFWFWQRDVYCETCKSWEGFAGRGDGVKGMCIRKSSGVPDDVYTNRLDHCERYE